jgi:hypothetical protein
MGLDDFKEDSSSNSSSSSSSTSNKSSNSSGSDNSPSAAKQAFCDLPKVNPRAIKNQIRVLGDKWVKQFSTRRFDEGELVMYGAGTNAKKSGKTVMIFTSIQQVTDDIQPDENKDMKVTCWDLDKRKAIGDPTIIEAEPRWKTELYKAIESKLDELDRKT